MFHKQYLQLERLSCWEPLPNGKIPSRGKSSDSLENKGGNLTPLGSNGHPEKSQVTTT